MTVLQKIRNIITGLIMMAASVLIVIIPDVGYNIVLLILGLSLLFYGIKTLIYYFTLAKNMVGGRAILYLGVIVLDFGVFTLTIADNSVLYIIVYLLIMHLFLGLVDILRALEVRKNAGHWRFKLSQGIVNIAIAIVAFLFGIIFKRVDVLVYIYALGLSYSAITKIITAFRKSAIVYIQ